MNLKKYINRSDFVLFVRGEVPDTTEEEIDLYLRHGDEQTRYHNGELIFLPDDIYRDCGFDSDEEYNSYLVERYGTKGAEIAKFLSTTTKFDSLKTKVYYSW